MTDGLSDVQIWQIQYEGIVERSESLINKIESLHGTQGRADIDREACILLEACWRINAAPPIQLLFLVARCLGVDADPFVKQTRDIPTTNYDAWDRAVEYEGRCKQDSSGDNPSVASLNSVAKAAFPDDGDHRRTVREWRLTSEYQREVEVFRYCVEEGLIDQ